MVQLFLEQLTVIDCGLLHPRRGLVGMSWIVDVRLAGTPGADGMVVDFGPAKRLIKRRIDALVDHRLLVPAQAPGLQHVVTGARSSLVFDDAHAGRIEHRGPAASVCVIDCKEITTAAVAARLQRELAAALPAVTHIEVELREEDIPGASYTYCHGLKRHRGNCQRIAHGHRSRLEILVDGSPSAAHAQRWARRWRDVFLGNRADLVGHGARYRFAYQTPAGAFELELEAQRCQLLDAETTVENIAAFIAAELKRQEPAKRFTVRAYEGVNKGAVAVA